jgi:zinc transporter ZupT
MVEGFALTLELRTAGRASWWLLLANGALSAIVAANAGKALTPHFWPDSAPRFASAFELPSFPGPDVLVLEDPDPKS